jgi:hypothetical protein
VRHVASFVATPTVYAPTAFPYRSAGAVILAIGIIVFLYGLVLLLGCHGVHLCVGATFPGGWVSALIVGVILIIIGGALYGYEIARPVSTTTSTTSAPAAAANPPMTQNVYVPMSTVQPATQTPPSMTGPGTSGTTTAPTSRYCPSCGALNGANAAYCAKCGTALPGT